MRNSAVVQYKEYPISLGTLRELPSDHASVLAVLSFATTEINALRRIFLSQSHEYTGDKIIDEAINTQKFVVLRTWNSKLFEVREFLRSLCGKKPETNDEKIIALAKEALEKFDAEENSDGYLVAREVRHEMSSHYAISVARKNLPYVHTDAPCGYYIHQHGGNDFFPVGEAVMFHGRLHRKWQAIDSLEDRRNKLDQWFAWCLHANSVLSDTHAKFSSELLFQPLGDRSFHRTFEVPETLVGHPYDRLTPVFFSPKADQL